MIRNRVRWGYGLLALLLTLSTVACGGDEPAPVVQPPAPPPAPPPFQPQAVEVALGESGNVTLMTTEDGGFTLNGEAFESGGTVAAENGNMYLLTLADGKWSAAYQASEAKVTLGITEEMVTLTKSEDGNYMIGDMAVTSGETTVSATNGNMYTLSMDEDGMWMATYVEPVQTVMLGTHGGSEMIKKSEDGSYWLGDMTVMNGTVVSGEGGREYTLMMGEDGMWMATFVEHVQTVTLGMHGGTEMVKKSEDGSYWVGDMTVMNGSTVSGEGGRMYTLMMGDDGMWTATYVVPSQPVMLGMSGTTVTVMKAENGNYMIGDQMLTSGMSTATAMYMGNTNTYSLTMGDDGMWTASYVPEAGTVALGGTGISIPAMRAEGGAWSAMHPQTQETVMLTEGGMVTATNPAGYTNTYMLSSDGMGMWTAAYQSVTVPVMLGASGSNAPLTRAEDGSWWHEGDAFMSGDEVHAENGNHYVLTYADGAWSATFEPMEMMIAGTGLTAMSLEDQSGYTVEGGDITLMGTAAGQLLTVMVEGDSRPMYYRVWMDDGVLTGARTDKNRDGDTTFRTVGMSAHVAYNGNDRTTVLDESNTKLIIETDRYYTPATAGAAANAAGATVKTATEEVSLGPIFGMGSYKKDKSAADGAPGEFVKKAVEDLMALRDEADLYARYQAENPGTEDYDDNLNRIADRAQTIIDTIFDRNPTLVTATTDTTDPRHADNAIEAGLPKDTPTGGADVNANDIYVRATDTIRALTTLLNALSSADAFVEATAKGMDGIFEGAFAESAARSAFSANRSEYEVWFGSTGSVRYGAITLAERAGPDPDATYTDGVITAYETDAATAVGSRRTRAARYDTVFHFDGFDDDDGDGIIAQTGTSAAAVAEDGAANGYEDVGRIGAFAFANAAETVRARRLPQAGGATYEGGTVAVTPGKTSARPNQLYRGNMRIDVNFRRGSVFGRISELKDKDGRLWQYLDRDVAEIYLPQRFYNNDTAVPRFGDRDNAPEAANGTNEDSLFGTATIVYTDTHGFPLPTQPASSARFGGGFIGGDGADIAGTWSIGNATTDSDTATVGVQAADARDVIYGSYGVTRIGDRPLSGAVPAEEDDGSTAETVVQPTGTSIVKVDRLIDLGTFHRAKPDETVQIELVDAFAKPGAKLRKATAGGPTYVEMLRAEIEKQRQLYEIFVSFGDDVAVTIASGTGAISTTNTANQGRQRAWKAINDAVREHLFGLTSLYDNSATTTETANFVTITGADDTEAALGSLFYPRTRTERPDDDAALARIDALLDAIANKDNFIDAFADHSGRVFDSQPALDKARPDPFPGTFGDGDLGEAFGERTSLTTVWSLSTNYTRFGVWWRQQSPFAVEDKRRHVLRTHETTSGGTVSFTGITQADLRPTGSTDDPEAASSPNAYAYSWLEQSSYRIDRPEQTYPSEGVATYTGQALGIVDNATYLGDAEIKVTWGAVPATAGTAPTSTVLPKFSNLRHTGNGDPLIYHKTVAATRAIVDEIAFLSSASGNPNLGVTHAANGLLSVEPGTAVIARLTVSTRTGTSYVDVENTGTTFAAKFVGESLDGPLGITGYFSIAPTSGFTTANSAAQHPTRGNLYGSFGADLTDFETLFLP